MFVFYLCRWQSGRLRYQRSAVRIQSIVVFYNKNIYCQLLKRQKIKRGKKWPNLNKDIDLQM